MYQKALFAFDGSEFSRAAIPHVCEVTETEVLILEVIDSVGRIIARTTPLAPRSWALRSRNAAT